jgi:hypothetical protein
MGLAIGYAYTRRILFEQTTLIRATNHREFAELAATVLLPTAPQSQVVDLFSWLSGRDR